ncbi:UNVERIFIED_CONTAM: 4-nitrophenyl phosphatase [Brevibacillus sp. OAP136]
MKRYKGFLLDLDGTVYRGNEPIPEAVVFMEQLRKRNIPYLFLTNNSSTSPENVARRLEGMGIPTKGEEVYTTSMAAATYLRDQLPQGAHIYVIGEQGLVHELEQAGYHLTAEQPDAVVVGIDRSFTYEKLAIAAKAIRKGARFLATNNDAALPTEHGLTPGNGSLVAAVAVASGAEPVVVGKPEPLIVDYALRKLGLDKSDTLLIGDNLHTDILAGRNSGVDSLLVYTGYSKEADIERFRIQPTYEADSLTQWWEAYSPFLD